MSDIPIDLIINFISYTTSLHVDRVEKILSSGILDWYQWVQDSKCRHFKHMREEATVMGITLESIVDVEAALTAKDLSLITDDEDQFIEALSSGQIPSSTRERITMFFSAINRSECITNESRENILKVAHALYDCL
jgi:hypothetical protein